MWRPQHATTTTHYGKLCHRHHCDVDDGVYIHVYIHGYTGIPLLFEKVVGSEIDHFSNLEFDYTRVPIECVPPLVKHVVLNF
jgi:hypothetical protein